MKIHITKEAHDALRMAANGFLKDTAKPAGKGVLEVELEDDTYRHLEAARFPEESLSDTVVRLVATSDRPRQ